MEFEKQITVNASADKIWKILYTDFNEIKDWSSFVQQSTQNSEVADGAGRVCEVRGEGDVIENITEVDEKKRDLAYTVESKGNPFFIQKAVNSFHIEANGKGQAIVTTGVQITLAPVFKQLLNARLSKRMQKRADKLLGDLKKFGEKK